MLHAIFMAIHAVVSKELKPKYHIYHLTFWRLASHSIVVYKELKLKKSIVLENVQLDISLFHCASAYSS